MNKTVYPLMCMFFLFIYQIFKGVDIGGTTTVSGGEFNATVTVGTNQTSSVWNLGSWVIGIDFTTGLVSIIITLIAISVIVGVRALGSGLSEFTVQIITKGVAYFGLWLLLTVNTYSLFFGFWLGIPIYLFLTFLYVLGFLEGLK